MWGDWRVWLIQFMNTLITDKSLAGAFSLTAFVGTLPSHDCSLCDGVEPPPPMTLSEGLVNYWAFEEDTGPMIDLHGTFDITRVGKIALDLDCVTGSAANFNG